MSADRDAAVSAAAGDADSDQTDPAADGAPTDSEAFESGVEVEVHAHFGMTGSFPLRIAETFFASDGVHVAEYGAITPMFGIGARKHRREAAAMRQLLEQYGIDEVLARADAVTWLSYESLDRVVVSDGGRFGNPRLGIYAVDETAKAYRIHAEEFDPDDFVAELSPVADREGFTVEREAGLGYRPAESLRRFFG
ncbi:hypothetical protein [Halobaculum marinum]|uniref:Uncharacterized protein n=1 Tax=Halobaculum marinum TaxID=3031996 RepID=A0ABD5WZ49_9EURY|nr:hypothetical protein [Halobaculum sp. DT55]